MCTHFDLFSILTVEVCSADSLRLHARYGEDHRRHSESLINSTP